MQGKLTGCLVVIWVVTYLCIYNGAKSTGRVAYFTSTFPLLMLIVLVIKGLSLEGIPKKSVFGKILKIKTLAYNSDNQGN